MEIEWRGPSQAFIPTESLIGFDWRPEEAVISCGVVFQTGFRCYRSPKPVTRFYPNNPIWFSRPC
jgi:hypothetical protein